MSFALTTAQVRSRHKTVTRRLGWISLQPGALVQPVEKAQGLKKGEHVVRIAGPIRIESVRRERLSRLTSDPAYGLEEVRREGFAGDRLKGTPAGFASFFARTHGCALHDYVTRIEFSYVEEPATAAR